jgi:hypothetical protein
MTLAVSLKVPDGLVLAAESLQTLESTVTGKGEVGVKCPKCQEEFKISDLPLPPIRIPSGSSPTANKIYVITKREPNLGVATYGAAFLQGQTVESHLRSFEGQKVVGKETVQEISQKLLDYFQTILSKEVDVTKLPDGTVPIGFQVVGFDHNETEGKINLVETGKIPKISPQNQEKGRFGCTCSGDGRVVAKLWKEDPSIAIPQPNYGFMTLQDAVDYAVFLIRTTISYQTFATMIPTCGGEIDIMTITYNKGVEWVQKKKIHGEYLNGELSER